MAIYKDGVLVSGGVVTVVDNLTSTSTTDALSAAMGVFLYSKSIYDSGTNYIRFNDGTMLCWGVYYMNNLSCTTANGNGFYSYIENLGDWAQTFLSAPLCFKTIGTQDTSRIITLGGIPYVSSVFKNPTTTNAGGVQLIATGSTTGIYGNINFVGIGRWK